MMGLMTRLFARFSLSVFFLSYFLLGLSFAQSSAERVAKAKKEGTVNFYAVWQVEHLQALKKTFNKRYPTIQVNLLRQGA